MKTERKEMIEITSRFKDDNFVGHFLSKEQIARLKSEGLTSINKIENEFGCRLRRCIKGTDKYLVLFKFASRTGFFGACDEIAIVKEFTGTSFDPVIKYNDVSGLNAILVCDECAENDI